ncbi:MAG: glycosyltransferase [Bacteroidetes bacterium]|nr:MAG: glycosyltransferase [Bacteroidota bacterium]
MRIAFLSTFYPFRGGIAQFNASLYRAFEKEHSVKAFTFTRQYPDFLFPGETQMVTEKDNADKIPSERVLDTLNPLTYFSAADRIKEFGPDILLMKYWMSYMAPSLGTVAKKVCGRGRPTPSLGEGRGGPHSKVITVLDNVIPHEKRFFDTSFTKYFLKQNHGFVVMSDSVKNDLLKFIPDAKYISRPHPLYDHFGKKTDTDDAKNKLNIPVDKKVVLFFGFIRDYKGLDLLIDAVSKLNDEYVLVIAGEVYGSFDKYTQQIEKLGVQSKISLHVRYISDDEVPVFFSAADVCVLPYKSATQSGITSIAYHFDLPMIATDTGGLKESIEHNKTGIIVASPDSNLIAKAIQDYFAQNFRPKFQEEIKLLKNKLSWDGLANAIIDFSKSL